MNTVMIVLTALLAFAFVTLCVIAIINTAKKKKPLRLWLAAGLCIIALVPVSIIGSLSTDNPGSNPVVEQHVSPLTMPMLEPLDAPQSNKDYYGMMGNPADLTPLADYINAVFTNAGSNSYAELLDDGAGLLLNIASADDGETLEPILCETLKGKNVAKLWISGTGAPKDMLAKLECDYLGLCVSSLKKADLEQIKDIPNLKKVYLSFDNARSELQDLDEYLLASVDEVEFYGSLYGNTNENVVYKLNSLKLFPNIKKLVLRDVDRYYNSEYLKTINSLEEIEVTDDGSPELTAYFTLVTQMLPNIQTINGLEATDYNPYKGLDENAIASANSYYLYSLGQSLRMMDIPQGLLETQYGGTKNMAVQFVGEAKDGIKRDGCSQFYSGENSALADIFRGDVRECDFLIIMYPEYSAYGRYENNKPAWSTSVYLQLYDLKNNVCSQPIKVYTNAPPKTISAGASAGYGEFRFDKAWAYIEMFFTTKNEQP